MGDQKQLLRRCLFLIRKCQFRELIGSDRIKAMFYLQHDLSKVVDRTSEEQMSEFHQLTNLLFRTQEQQEEDELFHGQIGNDSLANNSYRLRSSVFDALAQYFPSRWLSLASTCQISFLLTKIDEFYWVLYASVSVLTVFSFSSLFFFV